MKTLIICLAVLTASLTATSQVSFGIGAGYGVTAKKAAAECHVAYDAQIVFFQAGMLTHLSNKVTAGSIFNIRMGHTVKINDNISLQPSAGYAYDLKSSTNKELNQSGVIGSLYLIKETAVPQLQLFGGGNYSKNAVILSIGIKFSMKEN